MAAPAAAAAAKAVMKQLLAAVASSAAKGSGEGSPGFAGALAAFAALAALSCWIVASAPLDAWEMATEAGRGPGGSPEGAYGYVEDMAEEQMVRWYLGKEEALRRYAQSRWSSGTGEDVYDTPDWRYLCAFDTALSENDRSLVLRNEEYYDSVHASLLRATLLTRVRSVSCDEGSEGAYEGEDGEWYRDEAYTTWTVSCPPIENAFAGKGPAGTLSGEFKYFAEHESAEYGGGWGDEGNAIGYYQFDRRYGLGDFLAFAVESEPALFGCLAPWAGMQTIPKGDAGLEEAWRKAYSEHPDEFAALQDEYVYSAYYLPAEAMLADMGFSSLSGRRDALKGLVCGMCNLMGPSGARRYFEAAALDDSMTDEEAARRLCGAVVSSPPQPYPDAYANRYRAELEEVLALLSSPADGPSEDVSANLGSDPSCEGGLFPLPVKGELAEGYTRALSAVTVEEGPMGLLRIRFDAAAFAEAVTSGRQTGAPEVASEEAERVVSAAKSVPSPGAGLCAKWVSQVYAAAGWPYPAGDACDMYREWCTSSDRADLAAGMAIAVDRSPDGPDGWRYGHICIYIGDGTVMDNVSGPSGGRIRTMGLQDWLDHYGRYSEPRWGFPPR